MSVELSVNGPLVLVLVAIGWASNGIASIVLGALGVEKDTKYGVGSVVVGLAYLLVFLWVILT